MNLLPEKLDYRDRLDRAMLSANSPPQKHPNTVVFRRYEPLSSEYGPQDIPILLVEMLLQKDSEIMPISAPREPPGWILNDGWVINLKSRSTFEDEQKKLGNLLLDILLKNIGEK